MGKKLYDWIDMFFDEILVSTVGGAIMDIFSIVPFYAALLFIAFITIFVRLSKQMGWVRWGAPKTKTWIEAEELSNVIKGSLPILKMKAEWNRSDDWNSPISNMQRVLDRKLLGTSDKEILQSRQETDAVIYYFEKIITDYPWAKKGNKYSKEIFEWALRNMGMEVN